MARIRTIKPEFWSDDKILELSPLARLLFIGTWNFADDAGNIDRSSKQLKARIFPGDLVEVEPLVLELLQLELMVEYDIAGRTYLHISNFDRHQRINRPSAPTCPPFYTSLQEDSVRSHGVSREDSLPEGKGREGKGMEGKHNIDDDDPLEAEETVFGATVDDSPQAENKTSSEIESCFEQLWAVYPRKDGKKAAFRHYRATVRTVADIDRINGALGNYLLAIKGKDLQYVKNGSTFFNNWQDWEPEEAVDA